MKNVVPCSLLFLLFILTGCAQKKDMDYLITISTDHGDMVAVLYDQTPKHKANFVKLANEGFYDDLLFHRVINGFMIQGGDPESRGAAAEKRLGNGGPGYNVEAEFVPGLFHEKGALSAARLGDEANPAKASSGSQFYIVQGKTYGADELSQLETNIAYGKKNLALREVLYKPENKALLDQVIEKQHANDVTWLNQFFLSSDSVIKKQNPGYVPFAFTPQQKETYQTVGGTPHLDSDYTVFGKVIKGLDVLDKIASLPTQVGDRPVTDVKMQVTVKPMARKDIEKEYGYTFPSLKK
ncbi:MAG: peptidylprolyl isomerase [Cyclobacteriaceae bacterium]|nr:peptidylprolyl isomerase [Cyclobacteriaceae bacterium]